jgi:hypothetical protein
VDDAAPERAERGVERAVGQVASEQEVAAARSRGRPAHDDLPARLNLHARRVLSGQRREVRRGQLAVGVEAIVGRSIGKQPADREVRRRLSVPGSLVTDGDDRPVVRVGRRRAVVVDRDGAGLFVGAEREGDLAVVIERRVGRAVRVVAHEDEVRVSRLPPSGDHDLPVRLQRYRVGPIVGEATDVGDARRAESRIEVGPVGQQPADLHG